jgi:hypothetical protein
LDRRGVAATIVSFVVFTSLVVANSVLYSSTNSSLGASVISAVEVNERTTSVVLEGVSTFDALSSVQAYLQANPLDCTSPGPYLAALSGSTGGAGSEGGISFRTQASWAYSSLPLAASDDPMLSSFSGSSGGALNMSVSVSIDESHDGNLPTYATTMVEAVHLPVSFSSAVSLCQWALSYLALAVSSLQYCNSTGAESVLSTADELYPVLSSFSLAASANQTQGGCLVNYSVRTSLPEVGLEGQFQWSVQGEGALVIPATP